MRKWWKWFMLWRNWEIDQKVSKWTQRLFNGNTMALIFPVTMTSVTVAMVCAWKIDNDILKWKKIQTLRWQYKLEQQCGRGPFLTTEPQLGKAQLLVRRQGPWRLLRWSSRSCRELWWISGAPHIQDDKRGAWWQRGALCWKDEVHCGSIFAPLL